VRTGDVRTGSTYRLLMPVTEPHTTHQTPADAGATPAWRSDELSANPHANEQKAEKVRRMFSAIAGSYDLNNRLHSFWRDQAWRRAAVRLAGVTPGDRVLDCACGTGDLTRAFADGGAASVVGLDYTPAMLDIARTKRLTPRHDAVRNIRYVQGDAMDLPFDDGSFEVVSIAFGIRNVAEPARAFAEFRRVLTPGGRVVVLEFDKPRVAPIRWASDFYTERVMPITATLVSRDRSGAYKYLPRSVDTFYTREQMIAALGDAGFENVTAHPQTFGVCVCYVGSVPGAG
jgi:demethylmenaquinone methyltransferase/2-methoxy-6-polyprenyl-1,4-benzoquinol methylase